MDNNKKLTISFNDTIDNLIEWIKYNQKTTYKSRLNPLYIVVGVLLLIMILQAAQRQFDSEYLLQLILYTFVLGVFLYLIFSPKRHIRNVRKLYRRPENAAYFGRMTMMFDEKGITFEMVSGSRFVKWNYVYKTLEMPHCFFVYVSGLSAYTIPKNQLSPEETTQIRAIFANYLPTFRVQIEK